MKLFAVFFFTSIATIGWSQEFPIGKWKVSAEQTMLQQRDIEKVRLDTIPQQFGSNVRNHLDGRVYNFQKNGTFELMITVKGYNKSFQGSWRSRKNTLTLSFDNGDKADYSFSSFGGSWLLKMSGSIKEDALVNNLVLTSIN
ncbi:MAG TPA: hypothetical protein PK185_16090 [Cyclobacteriaceae bacterium]|nr:hypothetical protein [Cyclobacteriaceae bacterium]